MDETKMQIIECFDNAISELHNAWILARRLGLPVGVLYHIERAISVVNETAGVSGCGGE